MSKNFSIAELRCRCGCAGHLAPAIAKNLEHLAAMLEQIRMMAGGRAVTVNCAYRCPRHNAAVGGEPDSQHLRGLAADITVAGMMPAEVAILAQRCMLVGAIGKYNTFTHVDMRQRIAGRITSWIG
jgi:uncharacterized protein YcbK (DUF882 family)